MNEKNEIKQYVPSLILLGCFLLWIILLKTVDVAAIGPEDTKVGFSHLNNAVHGIFGFSAIWYGITKAMGIICFLIVGVFALLGILQLVVRKSISKVDIPLQALGVLYAATAVLYVFFEIVVINCRPIIMPGKDHVEASFPSTHTLLAVVVFISAFMMFGRYIQKENVQAGIQIACIALMVVTVIGRLLSGVHWLTDIIGGILLGSCLVCAFVPLSNRKRKRRRRKAKPAPEAKPEQAEAAAEPEPAPEPPKPQGPRLVIVPTPAQERAMKEAEAAERARAEEERQKALVAERAKAEEEKKQTLAAKEHELAEKLKSAVSNATARLEIPTPVPTAAEPPAPKAAVQPAPKAAEQPAPKPAAAPKAPEQPAAKEPSSATTKLSEIE